jgi:hypothetical protein
MIFALAGGPQNRHRDVAMRATPIHRFRQIIGLLVTVFDQHRLEPMPVLGADRIQIADHDIGLQADPHQFIDRAIATDQRPRGTQQPQRQGMRRKYAIGQNYRVTHAILRCHLIHP